MAHADSDHPLGIITLLPSIPPGFEDGLGGIPPAKFALSVMALLEGKKPHVNQVDPQPPKVEKKQVNDNPPKKKAAAAAEEDIDAPDMALGKRNANLHDLDDDIEKELIIEDQTGAECNPITRFEQIHLPDSIKDSIIRSIYSEFQYEKPSKIQGIALPLVLRRPWTSMCCQSHNGCGKTLCFAIAILSRIDYDLEGTQAVLVNPTRELAIQNKTVLEKLGKYIPNLSILCSSETQRVHQENQIITDKVVVGTHGTLGIWTSKKWLTYEDVKVLVLDEADNLLDRTGFSDDTFRVLQKIREQQRDAIEPTHLQILMFSATYSKEIRNFATRICPDANKIWVPREAVSLDTIKQVKVYVKDFWDKVELIREYIFPNCTKLGQTLIFVRSRSSARQLHGIIRDIGFSVTAISGEMSYQKRDDVIDEFRKGITTVLISTDVLSRGFDVSDVTLVVNFDIPRTEDGEPAYETYLHRVGRTGRYKRRGAAFNLVAGRTSDDNVLMKKIEDYFQRTVPECAYDEDEIIGVLQKADLADKEYGY